MSARLHLPHPHLTDVIEHAAAGFFAGLFHHHAQPAYTDPAAVERWAEWTPTHQWMAEHGRTENEQ